MIWKSSTDGNTSSHAVHSSSGHPQACHIAIHFCRQLYNGNNCHLVRSTSIVAKIWPILQHLRWVGIFQVEPRYLPTRSEKNLGSTKKCPPPALIWDGLGVSLPRDYPHIHIVNFVESEVNTEFLRTLTSQTSLHVSIIAYLEPEVKSHPINHIWWQLFPPSASSRANRLQLQA